MRRVTRGPIAESIVMFTDEHNHLASEVSYRVQPLTRVQRRRVEDRSFFAARAPFDFVERVHAEMEEERPLQPHPIRLIGAWQNLRRLLGNDGVSVPLLDDVHRRTGNL